MRRSEGEWLAWFTPHQRNRRKKAARRRPSVFAIQLSHIATRAALAPEIGHDTNPRPSFSGSGAPECDGACDGSGPGPYGVAVVAALNDPLTVFLADNFPDVMAPHHDGANLGTARV